MVLLNSFCLNIIRAMVLVLVSNGANAKALELEESQLHGKIDQPDVINFVRRSQLDLSIQPIALNLKERISQEVITNKIFDLVYAE